MLPCQFHFTSFSELHKFAESDNLQNVRGIVLHCFQSREQGSENDTARRDIVIVNEEKKLLLLTLRAQFAEKDGNTLDEMIESGPVIFGMRLKVTTFNSLSLTTRASSGIMINPPAIESVKMKDSYTENKEELRKLLENKTYKDNDILLPYPKNDDVLSVSQIAFSLSNIKTAWVKGKARLTSKGRSFWYTACANCQKSLEADLSWLATCPSCKQESQVEAISRITIAIEDGTSSTTAVMCSPNAEKLMPFTVIQLKEAEENARGLLL